MIKKDQIESILNMCAGDLIMRKETNHELADPHYMYALARNSSQEEKKALAEGITAIMAALPDGQDDKDMATQVLIHLAREAGRDMKLWLSAKMAEETEVPRELAVFLANDDDFDVAEPIIHACNALKDEDLISLVQNKNDEIRMAVAARNYVSSAVALVLIATEQPMVMNALLTNPGAVLCDEGIKKLIELSKRIADIQEPLLMRPEITPYLATQMYWHVSMQLRQKIVERFHVQEAKIDQAMESIIQTRINEKNAQSDPSKNGASERIIYAERLHSQGKINSQMIIRTLRSKNMELFYQLLATKLSIPVDCIRIITGGKDARLLATLCQAADIGKVDFTTIYLLTRPLGKDGRVTDAGELQAAMLSYTRTKMDESKAAIQKWRDNPGLVDILTKLEL